MRAGLACPPCSMFLANGNYLRPRGGFLSSDLNRQGRAGPGTRPGRFHPSCHAMPCCHLLRGRGGCVWVEGGWGGDAPMSAVATPLRWRHSGWWLPLPLSTVLPQCSCVPATITARPEEPLRCNQPCPGCHAWCRRLVAAGVQGDAALSSFSYPALPTASPDTWLPSPGYAPGQRCTYRFSNPTGSYTMLTFRCVLGLGPEDGRDAYRPRCVMACMHGAQLPWTASRFVRTGHAQTRLCAHLAAPSGAHALVLLHCARSDTMHA